MLAIQQAWEAGDVGRMGELLGRHIPRPGQTDWRGFEWHVFWRRYQRARPIRTLPLNDVVWDLAATPNGQTVAVLVYDHANDKVQVILWDAATGREPRTFDGPPGNVRRRRGPLPGRTSSSPRGASSMQSGREGAFVNIWDAATGELLRSLGGPDGHRRPGGLGIGALAFSPDGKTLISGSDDKTIKLWDLETGHVLKTFEGHTGVVRGVAFSPDGRRIASASSDRTVKLWDVESGDALFTSPKFSAVAMTVAFSPATAGTSRRGAGGRGPGCGT